MGWWEGDHAEDIIGDGPADTIGIALEKIATDRQRVGKTKPSIEDMLSAIAHTINEDPARYLLDDDVRVQELVATIEPGPQALRSKLPATAPDLLKPVREALEAITAEYEDCEEARKPRLREVLKTFSFVLGYQPENYLSIAEGSSVRRIEVS